MTGVSIGWFDPKAIYPDPDILIGALKHTFKRELRRSKSWPFVVRSLLTQSGAHSCVSYALIGGHIPVHIDPVGEGEHDGRLFQFILEAEHRPALLATAATDRNTPILMGFAAPTQPQTFSLGTFELKPGMAVHFDITKQWHGVTGLPVVLPEDGSDVLPRAVIIQVSGFDADQIGDAVELAAKVIGLDLLASNMSGRA